MIERNRWYRGTYFTGGWSSGERVRFCVTPSGAVYIADLSGRKDGRREHVEPIELDETEEGVLRMKHDIPVPRAGADIDTAWWTRIENVEAE